MKLKYLITEDNSFVIFNCGQIHKDISEALGSKIVGAGFCNFARQADTDLANVHCWGRSDTLGIESREEDEKIINQAIQDY